MTNSSMVPQVVDGATSALKNHKLRQHTSCILRLVSDCKRNMLEVAYRLYDIKQHTAILADDGFVDVFDYAAKVLGYSKAMVYAMVSVAEKFIVKTSKNKKATYASVFAHDGVDFNVSQLQELRAVELSTAQGMIEAGAISPAMTTKGIRGVIKGYKEGKLGIDGKPLVDLEVLEDGVAVSAAEETKTNAATYDAFRQILTGLDVLQASDLDVMKKQTLRQVRELVSALQK